jgi:hypothetical protein
MSEQYQGYAPTQQQLPKKRHTVRRIFLGLVVLVAIIIVIVVATNSGGGSNGGSTGGSSPAAGGHTVVYSVSGTATSVSVDYVKDDNLGQAQQDVKVPWHTGVDMGNNLVGAQLIVQNKGASGSVTCKITDNGKVVSTTTSSGAYVIATCSQG